MKRKLLTLIFISFILLGVAQDSTFNKVNLKKNCIGIELFGTGLHYSVYYERNFIIKPITYQSIKVGVSYPIVKDLNRIFIPIDYNIYVGKRKNKIFFGAGIIGLIGTAAFPSGISAQIDYRKLYLTNSYYAVSKYGSGTFEPLLDIGYTAKLGFKHIERKIDFYFYLNCFYMRLGMEYHLQPAWPCTGFNFKF